MCLTWESVQTFFREIEKEIAKTPKSPLFYVIFVFIKFFKLVRYVFDLGSDNWIAYGLIEQCHFKYALIQFCFIWILPGLFNFGVTMKVSATSFLMLDLTKLIVDFCI